MRRSIQIPIALWILGSIFVFPTVPGMAVSQPQHRGTVCQEQEPATPQVPATPAATPEMTEAGPAGVFQSDASRIELEHGSALLWLSGERSVLLHHGAAYDAASWEDQARALASQGFTVLAMEELAPDAVRDGLTYLMDTCGAQGVTVIGASAGGAPALEVLSEGPAGISGLILLGATGQVGTLGEYPKLFVASEGEGLTDQLMTMASEAPGNRNGTLILPGSAHAQAIFDSGQGDALIDAILAFLTETAVCGE